MVIQTYRVRAFRKRDAAIAYYVFDVVFFFANKFHLMVAFIGGGMCSLARTAGCAHESGVLLNKLARLFDVRLWFPKTDVCD